MKIFVYGKNKKFKNKELSKMTKFFLSKIMKNKNTEKLKIYLSFDRRDKQKGCIGYTEYCNKNSYIIWIDSKKSKIEQVETIAHELVHVKQFYLREVDPVTFKIKNKHLRGLSNGKNNYWDHPMEIEAYGRTVGLVYRWYYR